ncbi:hypothetical protein N9N28_08915 [Rubripirellula amarantea]|nr:hypothetical protein [Rubripirellula amarantea]
MTDTLSSNSEPRSGSVTSKGAVASFGYLGAAQFVDGTLMLVQMTAVVRFVSIDDYGRLAAAMTWALFVSRMCDLKSWEVILVLVPKHLLSGNSVASSSVLGIALIAESIGAIASFAIVVALVCPIAFLIQLDPTLLAILAIGALFRWAEEPLRAVLRLAECFSRLAWWRVSISVVRTAVVVGAAWSTQSIVLIAFATTVVSIISVISLYAVSHSAWEKLCLSPFSASARLQYKSYRPEVLRLLFHTKSIAFAAEINGRADLLLLNALSNPSTFAIYDLAKRFWSQIHLVTGPLQQVLYPKLAKEAIASGAELIIQLKRLTFLIAVCVAVALPIAYFSIGPVSEALLGEDYSGVAGPFQRAFVW